MQISIINNLKNSPNRRANIVLESESKKPKPTKNNKIKRILFQYLHWKIGYTKRLNSKLFLHLCSSAYTTFHEEEHSSYSHQRLALSVKLNWKKHWKSEKKSQWWWNIWNDVIKTAAKLHQPRGGGDEAGGGEWESIRMVGCPSGCSKIVVSFENHPQKGIDFSRKRARVVSWKIVNFIVAPIFLHWPIPFHTTQVDVDTCALQKSKHPVFVCFFFIIIIISTAQLLFHLKF